VYPMGTGFPFLVRAVRLTACVTLALSVAACGGTELAGRFEPRATTFESDPAGALLYVDGGHVGTTPATFHLPAKDEVRIRLELPGYFPQKDLLLRAKDVPVERRDAEGVGWEGVYYYALDPRGS